MSEVTKKSDTSSSQMRLLGGTPHMFFFNVADHLIVDQPLEDFDGTVEDGDRAIISLDVPRPRHVDRRADSLPEVPWIDLRPQDLIDQVGIVWCYFHVELFENLSPYTIRPHGGGVAEAADGFPDFPDMCPLPPP